MTGLLDTLNAAIWTILGGFLLFLLVRRFAKGDPSRHVRFGDVELPIRHAFGVACLLLLIALSDKAIYEQISRWRTEAGIPDTDPRRLSVVIPDFQGPSGDEAADTVAAMLQSSLGSGVQVLRVPRLQTAARYGDADAGVEPLRSGSLFCAARYNADVVIWGTYLPATQQLSVNYTARGGRCFPSNCGALAYRHPRLFPLSDAHDPASGLARELSGSVVTALGLATSHDGSAARAGECLANPGTARSFATKARSLLSGGPAGLQGERLSAAAGYAALFQQRLFEHSGNIADLDAAISLLTSMSARHIGFTSQSAGMLSSLIVDRAEGSQNPSEVLRLAERVGPLVGAADIRDREEVRLRYQGLLERAFYLGPAPGLLERAERYHSERLRLGSLPDRERLHHTIRIAGLRAQFFSEAAGPDRHSQAIQYARQAYQILDRSSTLRQQMSTGERCTLVRSDTMLTVVHGTAAPLAAGFNRAARLVNVSNVDWTNSHCADAFHGLALLLSRLASLSEPGSAAQLLRAAVEYEELVTERDQTQPAHHNQFRLAVAAAELARASREMQDRQRALLLLRSASGDAAMHRNAPAQQLLARLIAELR